MKRLLQVEITFNGAVLDWKESNMIERMFGDIFNELKTQGWVSADKEAPKLKLRAEESGSFFFDTVVEFEPDKGYFDSGDLDVAAKVFSASTGHLSKKKEVTKEDIINSSRKLFDKDKDGEFHTLVLEYNNVRLTLMG